MVLAFVGVKFASRLIPALLMRMSTGGTAEMLEEELMSRDE